MAKGRWASTSSIAAVQLDGERAVGIDIEYRSDRVKRIRSRFLAPEEEQNIDTAHEEEHLLVYWCAKEALYKLAGQEEVDFREQLHISPFPYRLGGLGKPERAEANSHACLPRRAGICLSLVYLKTKYTARIRKMNATK